MQVAKDFKSLPRCQVSNDLLWEMTRNYSSYLVRGPGLVLSRDPLNLTGLNTKRDSGFNNGAIGISTEVVNKKVSQKKVKKTAGVVKFNLAVRTRRALPKKKCTQLKGEPTSNNLVYSNSRRLTARSVAKVIILI